MLADIDWKDDDYAVLHGNTGIGRIYRESCRRT
jgi:hypothetical protein